jgi:glucose-1-phosphate thymidylyltransferase
LGQTLVEKPQEMSNNLALVGFYYFKTRRRPDCCDQRQMDRSIVLKGEYFLADAINLMLENGAKIRPSRVETWLDAGTPQSLLETNQYLLDHGHDNSVEAAKRPGLFIIPAGIHTPVCRCGKLGHRAVCIHGCQL